MGSINVTQTIGIDLEACLAASVGGTLPVTKRLGLSRANSSAIRGSRSKSGVLGAVFDFDQTYRVKGGRVVCAIVE